MKFYFILFLLILLSGCARRGRPEGGPKDFDKPIMVKTEPEFKSLHFKSKEIKIYFDEYIKLDNVTSQLIVSPPLKYPPIISPQGTPSKRITIKLKDTLQENTTYTFNFGQSIIDNTEGNILENFKYIFSTGDYIDSLEVKGTIKDAFDLEMKEKPTLMLYRVNENFKDSIIYSDKPMYVGSTLDSVNWNITNIKAGKYLLLALNDKSKNYKFNPKEDKIGFASGYITVPKDTSYNISLFSEVLPFRLASKPVESAIGHIIFGYEGDATGFSVKAISKVPADFNSISTFDKEKDTLHYWFKNFDKDSLRVQLTKNKIIDTVTVKFFAKEMDSLKLKISTSGTLHLRDTFKLISNVPIVEIDTSKIYFINKDSVRVAYSVLIAKNKEDLVFNFEKDLEEKYRIQILPGAITDFYGTQNDSLKVQFRTNKVSNYSSVFLTLKNIKSYPIIVNLLNDSGKVVATKYSENQEEYQFINLQPSRFMVRIIYDTNKNKKWDSGNFLLKQQPEEVYYFKNIITAKANWEAIEVFTTN
jgi:uncharacterized protein (DUF2141 family)